MGQEDSNFQQTYRNNLAQDLLKESHMKRIKMIREAQKKTDYILAKGEKIALTRGVNFTSLPVEYSRSLQNEVSGTERQHFVSNEPSLHCLFPFVDNLSGAVIGVGSDQVLNILANTKATVGYIVDYTESTVLFIRLLLEVGLYHHKLFNCYPSPAVYRDYFDDQNILHLQRIFSRNFSETETKEVIAVLKKGITVDKSRIPVTEYMKLVSQIKNNNHHVVSWMGTDEHINKVLDLYSKCNILIVKGDITDPEAMGKIGKNARDQGVTFDIIYLSNSESSFYTKEQVQNYWNILGKLPKGKNAVIMRTSWDVDYKLPLPPLVLKTRLRKQFNEWHYNVQRYTDWENKVKNNPIYLHKGWAHDINEAVRNGQKPESGISTLGFS